MMSPMYLKYFDVGSETTAAYTYIWYHDGNIDCAFIEPHWSKTYLYQSLQAGISQRMLCIHGQFSHDINNLRP